MPGWDNYPVRQHLVDHYAVPAVVDNDANMLGLGEQRRIYPDAHLVVFVKVGTGIGASVIVDGNLLRGSASAEGDIGHAKVRGITETCSTCGATGCLAATASGRAMARDLRRLGREAETTHDVVKLVRAGDAQAVRIVTEAGRALGEVLSTAVSLLNPDVVVIGGDIAHAHEHFLLGVRGAVLESSQPLASANLIMTPTQLGDRAGIAGVSEMVADAIFSSAAVDAAIGEAGPPAPCREIEHAPAGADAACSCRGLRTLSRTMAAQNDRCTIWFASQEDGAHGDREPPVEHDQRPGTHRLPSHLVRRM